MDAIEEFVHEWRNGDRVKAREMARAYVHANRNALAHYQRMTRDELVQRCTDLRASGDVREIPVIEMWLLSEYEPQRISGRIRPGGA